ncbi:MAG: MoaD/ThiS family protein [Methanomicrobiales archaeon]|nr:MoaD/ThiS family protein [Methanomicrobiales archaeon]
MQVILPDKSVRTLPGDPLPVAQILMSLGIKPSGVIVVKNGCLVPDDVLARGDDQIRLIRIAHGG